MGQKNWCIWQKRASTFTDPQRVSHGVYPMTPASAAPHWLVRSIGSAALTPSLLLAVVGTTLLALGVRGSAAASSYGSVIAVSLALVALGCAALTWVRPQRAGLSPPYIMLSLGFGGMLLGLGVDLLLGGPARLESLCTQSASLSFIESLELHMAFLPAMHAGMLTGGLLAIPSLRLLRQHCGRYLCSVLTQNLLCSAWMLLGMTAGALWLVRWQVASGTSSLPGMLGGMFVGMIWGMVASVALYRAFFALRNRNPEQE